MPALRSPAPAQGAPRPAAPPRQPAPRLASADDHAVASPAAALQAALASKLTAEGAPRRWRINVVPLTVVAVSAGLWWGIITVGLALVRG